MGVVGGRVVFWWGMMCDPSGARWRVVVARENLSSMRWMFVRNDLDVARPWDRAC